MIYTIHISCDLFIEVDLTDDILLILVAIDFYQQSQFQFQFNFIFHLQNFGFKVILCALSNPKKFPDKKALNKSFN